MLPDYWHFLECDMSKIGQYVQQMQEQPDFWLVGDYPNSGHEEPIPDEPPKDYVVVDDKTDELPF